MQEQYGLLIENEWKTTAEVQSICNPYNGERIADVCMASRNEADAAIAAAQSAFAAMRTAPAHERAGLLRRVADKISRRGDEFARCICLEAGKPMAASRGEVGRAVTTFELAAEEATRMYGEVLPLDIAPAAGARLGITRRFPLGPVLAITPFNFPLNLVAHKIAPALAAGNTVVHKPSSSTPLTAALLGEVLLEAGMPPGAVNILPCPAAVAEEMVRDERLHMVSFTGSPAVGWHLKGICGRKKVALELGGNAAAVIEPDADLAHAVERCAVGGYAYAGQVCISLQRIYVHESIYDDFAGHFTAKVQALSAGDPGAEATVVGPLITAREADRVQEWVDEACSLGGKLLAGGTREGNVYAPTLLEGVPKKARCVCREVFGPVTVLFPYRSFDKVLDEVNDSAYGLQAGVFTRCMDSILKAFNRLAVGGVIVNEVPTFRVDNFPYGGIKESGFGREGVRYAMEEMTELKVLVVDNPQ
ncbi:aldehyde dehydrogenase family protein [Thermodesulfobacteriota bacterium]